MFAVSALSVQNVNAQNADVKKDNTTQAAQPKQKVQSNEETAKTTGAPIHKAQGNTSKKTLKKETTMKNDAKQAQQNSNEPVMRDMQKPGQKNDAKAETKKTTEPVMRDMQKPGQKNDAKAETKKAEEPAMRSSRPQGYDAQAQPKQVKPDYNRTGKTTLKPTQESATRPKMKKESKTTKVQTGDIK